MPRLRSPLLSAAALLVAFTTMAAAQADYPNRPVRLIIPFPPGGSNDVVGRVIAQHLGDVLGKQVIVDNRGGAGGVVGTEQAAHAAPDGYTLLGISLAHAVNPWLYKLPYDPIKAFAPIGIMGSGPNVVAVNPSLPVNSIKDLIALAKSKPGDIQYASAGIGSFQHLGGELFKLEAGVDILHVPFKGGAQAVAALLGEQVDIVVDGAAMAQVKAGKLKALAVTGPRLPALPDVPGIGETVKGFSFTNWWGVLAPAGTPPEVVNRLNAELVAIAAMPDVRDKLRDLGLNAQSGSPQAFGDLMRTEAEKVARIVKGASIKLE